MDDLTLLKKEICSFMRDIEMKIATEQHCLDELEHDRNEYRKFMYKECDVETEKYRAAKHNYDCYRQLAEQTNIRLKELLLIKDNYFCNFSWVLESSGYVKYDGCYHKQAIQNELENQGDY